MSLANVACTPAHKHPEAVPLPCAGPAFHVHFCPCRDGDHKLTKGDVIGAIGPLMHTAQAGIVFMGSTEAGPKDAASLWEDFRDSMRDLATDQVAAAIASGAFDEVDATRIGTIQGVAPCSCMPAALLTVNLGPVRAC